MRNRLGPILGISTVLLLIAALPVLGGDLPPGGTFIDDDDSIHEADIEAIAAAGITRGCNPPANDQFCPDDPVTRGQMAAFLHRALGDVLDSGEAVQFTDTAGSIFEADIEWLGSTGVTRGCNPPANDQFCPDSNVTRGQMAAFLTRALGYEDDGGGDHFVDDDESIFEADIDRLRTAGVTLGCNPPTNDRYCPDDDVTRAQMASFLTRALGLEPMDPPPPTSTTTSSSTTSSTTSSTSSSTTTTTMPQEENVDNINFIFDPAGIEIEQGTTVRWTNQEGTHTVTSGDGSTGTPDGLFDSGTMSTSSNTEFTFTFTETGTFTYFCQFHWSQGMTGTVTVVGS